MNVLFVLPWDQKIGGVQQVVGNLARYLRSHGHRIIFFNPGEANFLERKTTTWGFNGFELQLRSPFHKSHPLRSILAFLFFFPMTMFQIIRLVRRERVQIINVHYATSGFLYFALCRWLLAVKLVISVHGADFFPGGQKLTR